MQRYAYKESAIGVVGLWRDEAGAYIKYADAEQLERVADEMAKALKLSFKVPRPWIDGGISWEVWNGICEKIDAALASYAAWKEKLNELR